LSSVASSRARRVAAAFAVAALGGCGGDPPSAPDLAADREYRLEPLLAKGSPFHGVHGLRFDDQGRLHATSVIGQSIFRVNTATGTVERVVGPREGMADDLAFAADGTMYWTAIEDGIIYAMSPDGTVRRVLEDRKGVNAIAFNPERTRLFFTLVFYGDALYELDQGGAAAPRLIADGLGGLNSFQVGDDGLIYGPLVFGARVVKIDPDSGEIATVSTDMVSPGALKLDGKGGAYVLDDQKLKRIDLATGTVTDSAQLPHDPDNLAIDAEGRVFVSMAAPNAIAEVNVETGAIRYVIGPTTLNSPTGLAVATDAGRDVVYAGDLFGGVRRVDGASGALLETPSIELFQPAHVAVAGDRLIVVSQVFGTIQRLDRSSLEVLAEWEGFAVPGDAVEASNGDLIVAETGTGRLLRVEGPEPLDWTALLEGLVAPTGVALGADGSIYVTETGAGRLLRLSQPGLEVLAEGLGQPEGIALDAAGGVLVLEVARRRITRIAPSGEASVIATDLPVGLSDGPSLYRGLAAGADAVYFTSDIDNTIYKLTPSAP
jgi:sugar lactone lactonase YvrE